MKILSLLFAVLALSSCKNLTPEQNSALFNAALTTGQRVVDKATK